MNELEHWFRYDFLPRQPDAAQWRDKPITDAALHFLREMQERLERARVSDDDFDY